MYISPIQKCWHYKAIDKDPNTKVNCPNCTHWGWTRCKDEKLLMDRIHEDSREFRAYDFMMRDNKGLRIG